MKDKVTQILKNTLPEGVHYEVEEYNTSIGKEQSLLIIIAANDYEINRVKDQNPQRVCLNWNLITNELEPLNFGGMGGQSINRKPNLNDDSEKHLAMKSVKVPFRRPRPETEKILKAIERFAQNWLKTLRENKKDLMYNDIVDYSFLD